MDKLLFEFLKSIIIITDKKEKIEKLNDYGIEFEKLENNAYMIKDINMLEIMDLNENDIKHIKENIFNEFEMMKKKEYTKIFLTLK